MQGLSAKIPKGLPGGRGQKGRFGLEPGTIDVVAQERVATMGQMNANLMGAAGLQPTGEQARNRAAVLALIPLEDLPMGDRLPAPGAYRLAVAGTWMAVDRSINGALGPVRHAPDEGEIAARERTGAAMVGELGGERVMRAIVLGHDHEPAGVLVEPVHDAGPLHPADP